MSEGYFGGRFVPEMLVPALEELEHAHKAAVADPEFNEELALLMASYSGRPTPLYRAERLAHKIGELSGNEPPRIYLKMEALNHTGAHKINNAIGQALLARRMGKTHLIAETGAGQHGVAVATVAARFGMECTIYMGEVDMARQYPNVYTMRLLGAEVRPVSDGSRTLKDAVNATLKHWISAFPTTYYLIGSALGPHPFPDIVRGFQSVIGVETKRQIVEAEGRLPSHLIACVGGGSNSIGLFHPFLDDDETRKIGVEAGGIGDGAGENAIRILPKPRCGIIQGYRSFFILDEDGQVGKTHSISAGLDYPGIGPELAHLYRQGLIEFTSANDNAALEGYRTLARCEGIVPALESAHAVGWLLKEAGSFAKGDVVVVNLSGRGEKDLFITAPMLDSTRWKRFLQLSLEELHGE